MPGQIQDCPAAGFCLPSPLPWGLARLGLAWVGMSLHQASGWTLTPGGWGGRDGTSIPHDVDFCWDPVPSWPCGPNLYQGMADVFWNCNFYPVLAGEVERGSWV